MERWKKLAAGAIGAVAAAALGAALFYRREKATVSPDYTVERGADGFELRRYPAMLLAETVQAGPRERAMTYGFGLLADYIFAESREGRALALAMPLIVMGAGDEAWRVRLPMPRGAARESLPEPGDDVAIVAMPARRIAALRFAGRDNDALLAGKSAELQAWLREQALEGAGEPEFAFYSAPPVPGPLRHNEVMIAVGEA
jgi:hypothetical protein